MLGLDLFCFGCSKHVILVCVYAYLEQQFSWFRNSTLNILMGSRLPALPIYILYLHTDVLSLLLVFSIVIITNHMLWKLEIFDLPTSKSLVHTCVISVSCHVLKTVMYIFLPVSFVTCLLALCKVPQM